MSGGAQSAELPSELGKRAQHTARSKSTLRDSMRGARDNSGAMT